jgi:hypothetical protein
VPLTTEQRAAFLEILPALGDEADPRRAQDYARSHRAALLDELGALPGVDQVRAGALRLLSVLVPDHREWAPHLAAAGAALVTAVGPSPVQQLARHPAWIGLAVLELADLQDDWDGEPIDRALELAGRAFAVHGTPDEVGEGEVAWAMAEQAEDAGWTERAAELLEEALRRPFANPERRAEARLVAAIARDQRGEEATSLLESVLDDDDADDRARSHAGWILAHVREREASIEGARDALRRALQHVDPGNAEVRARMAERLAEWASR